MCFWKVEIGKSLRARALMHVLAQLPRLTQTKPVLNNTREQIEKSIDTFYHVLREQNNHSTQNNGSTGVTTML